MTCHRMTTKVWPCSGEPAKVLIPGDRWLRASIANPIHTIGTDPGRLGRNAHEPAAEPSRATGSSRPRAARTVTPHRRKGCPRCKGRVGPVTGHRCGYGRGRGRALPVGVGSTNSPTSPRNSTHRACRRRLVPTEPASAPRLDDSNRRSITCRSNCGQGKLRGPATAMVRRHRSGRDPRRPVHPPQTPNRPGRRSPHNCAPT
jgi:hypothetical protein